MDALQRESFLSRQHALYAAALADIVTLITTMKPDDLLVSYIYRILARAVSQAYDLPFPFEGIDP